MAFEGYEIAGQVGAGSTGVVWKAVQVTTDRTVAIKQLAPVLAADDVFRAQFRAEARLLASLTHPNVVAVYDYVEDDETPYLVEEFVNGAPLTRVVSAAGRLDARQAAGVLRGALRGLAAAHALGLVHGDISGTNILVDTEGTSKLIDFGLSAPRANVSSGTPAYASPEAVRGEQLDARSDVYSAGCVLFELLAGSPPFGDEPNGAAPIRDPDAAAPPCPGSDPHIAAVVARALALDPADRYPDGAAFLAALEESAERDLGGDWLTGASIATLVASATKVGALAGSAGAAGTTTPSATTAASGRASNIVKFVARHRLPVAIGTAAVGAAVVVGLVVGSGSPKKPVPVAAPTAHVDLTATGAHPFHLVGTQVNLCSSVDIDLTSTEYPALGPNGELSITPQGIKAQIGGKLVGDVNESGITFTSNPTGVTLAHDVSESFGKNVTHLNGVITCPQTSGAAAAGGTTPTVGRPVVPSPTTVTSATAAPAFLATYDVTWKLNSFQESFPGQLDGAHSGTDRIFVTCVIASACDSTDNGAVASDWMHAGITPTMQFDAASQRWTSTDTQPFSGSGCGNQTVTIVNVVQVVGSETRGGRKVATRLHGETKQRTTPLTVSGANGSCTGLDVAYSWDAVAPSGTPIAKQLSP